MPAEKKLKSTLRRFSKADVAAARAAADTASKVAEPSIRWNEAVVTHGGGVAATIKELRRSRGPNRNPTKEQVAIRFDPEVLAAFRSEGPGWQTRMNAALKEWLERRKSQRAKSRTTNTKPGVAR